MLRITRDYKDNAEPRDSKARWIIEENGAFVSVINWSAAITWLDGEVRAGRLDGEQVILAGTLAVPWVLDEYLDAAESAEQGMHSFVFDAYGRSAAKLSKSKEYHDQLSIPWQVSDA